MARATLSLRELLDQLERARRPGPGALVFDADGTLWSGDVSEDTFEHAVEHRLLREEAREALEHAAREHGLAPRGTPSEIAGAIFQAYRDGRYPERDVCAMMTWCYAGYTLDQLRDIARDALARRDLASRLHHELEPVIEWARERGLAVIITSASPRRIVEEGAALWGFAPSAIAASTPALDGARILPRMAGDVPYAEHKVPAARALIGDADWLASFGDNLFDEAMLLAARIGVAVRPKPALRRRLPELPGIVLFDS